MHARAEVSLRTWYKVVNAAGWRDFAELRQGFPSADQVERLRRAGANEAVQPEFEAGVEVIRHALRRYGIGGMELVNMVAGRRAAFYRRALDNEPR